MRITRRRGFNPLLLDKAVILYGRGFSVVHHQNYGGRNAEGGNNVSPSEKFYEVKFLCP